MIIKHFLKYLKLGLILISFHSCSSYEQFRYLTEEFEIPAKVFRADFHMTWQAALDVMKKYELASFNQEIGLIKTHWIDNTLELNFADSFSNSDSVKAAKFKLIINIIKGFKGAREVSKITIFKRQLIEQGFLQGWKEMPTDGIQEKTILYRINRTLLIEKKLKAIEDQRTKELEKEDPF